MPFSSAYVIDRNTGSVLRFTGVTAVSHALSLRLFDKADITESGSFVNGAKNEPDRVTLSVAETDAEHAAGWSARMLDTLSAMKRERRLCRVVTPHHAYDDMLLSGISVTQDGESPDGWSGDLTFTEYIPVAVVGEVKTDTNASVPKNTGSAAPAQTVSAAADFTDNRSSYARSAAGMTVGTVSLDAAGSLSQKLARAGISTEQLRYIV